MRSAGPGAIGTTGPVKPVRSETPGGGDQGHRCSQVSPLGRRHVIDPPIGETFSPTWTAWWI